MAGVLSPLSRVSAKRSISFLVSYAVGSAVAAVMMAVPLILVSNWLSAEVSVSVRVAVAVGFGALLLLADVLGHTPSSRRQTPQSLARTLGTAPLGLVYGLDVGLIYTTQMASSLPTIALAGATLSGPDAVVRTLVAFWAVTLLLLGMISILSHGRSSTSPVHFPSMTSRAAKLSRQAGSLAALAVLVVAASASA